MHFTLCLVLQVDHVDVEIEAATVKEVDRGSTFLEGASLLRPPFSVPDGTEDGGR